MAQQAIPLLSAEATAQFWGWLYHAPNAAVEPLLQEAGRQLAALAGQWLDEDLLDRPVVMLAGVDRVGYAGLIAARQLAEDGAWMQLLLSEPPNDDTALSTLVEALQDLGVGLAWAEEGWELPPTDLVIDAMSGASLRTPNTTVHSLIHLINSSFAPVISLAAPSGLDLITGQLATPHVQAAATLLLGWPSDSLRNEAVRHACGECFLTTVELPPALLTDLGVALPRLAPSDRPQSLHVTAQLALVTDAGIVEEA